jgi:hypothetical protein
MVNYQAWIIPIHLGAPIGVSHNIVLVRDLSSKSYHGNLMVMPQVLGILVEKLAISEANFRKKLGALPNAKLITVANPALLSQLRGLGVIKNKAPRVSLASIHTITSALKGYPHMQTVVGALNMLKTVVKDTAGPAINMAHMVQQPPPLMGPTPVLTMQSPDPQGSTSQQLVVQLPPATLFYPYTTSFPDTLPDIRPNLAQLTQKYGLFFRHRGSLLNIMPIKAQLPAYKAWCQGKMNFSRPEGVVGISNTTFEDHQQTISLFLGFCEMYQKVPMEALSLKLFSNHMLVLNWLAFCKARSSNTQHLISTISHIIRVLDWLKVKDPEASADPNKVSKHVMLVNWCMHGDDMC